MITAALAVLVVAGAGFVFRLVRGPSTADRVVALDGLLSVAVMGIAAYGVLVDTTAMVPVVVVVALVAFVGTAIFARFVERGGPS